MGTTFPRIFFSCFSHKVAYSSAIMMQNCARNDRGVVRGGPEENDFVET